MDKNEIKSQINMNTMYEAGMAFVKLGDEYDEDERQIILEGVFERLESIIESAGMPFPNNSDDSSFIMMVIGFIMGYDAETADVLLSNNVSFSTTAELIKEAMQKEET